MDDGWGLNLSDGDFQAFAELVRRKAGINLHSGKKELVRARLAKIIREGQYQGFGEYYQHIIQDETGDELVGLLDAIATNLTSFFREPKHFEFMARKFLPEMTATKRKKREHPHLRIWSAGCSTGEEPYSIVMTVLDNTSGFSRGDFKVLATDLSTKVLETAWRGVYPTELLEGLSLATLKKFFQKGLGQWAGWCRVRDLVRRHVTFRRLNLIEPWPFKRQFDMIFCRNVMIYFDKKTQGQLVNQFSQLLADGGYLLIGHSESLTGLDRRLKYVQPTIYQKKAA